MAQSGCRGEESQPRPDCEYSQDDGEKNIEDGDQRQSVLDGSDGVATEGREGGESPQEARDQQGEDPRGVFLNEVSEDTADQEATEEVAGQDTEWELMKGGPGREFLDAGGESPAGEGAESAAEEDEKGIHGWKVKGREPRDFSR